jgi:quinol monooxygenase YgiN
MPASPAATRPGGRAIIVVRFKVKCHPEKTEQALAAFEEVIAPSRAVDGVVSFDIGRNLADPDSIIAIEVFEDRAALERQESLPVVQHTIRLLEELLAAEPEAMIYHVSSSEPWGA